VRDCVELEEEEVDCALSVITPATLIAIIVAVIKLFRIVLTPW